MNKLFKSNSEDKVILLHIELTPVSIELIYTLLPPPGPGIWGPWRHPKPSCQSGSEIEEKSVPGLDLSFLD